jgi:glycosidase
MKKSLFFLALLVGYCAAIAQVVTVTPTFPTASDNVTIFFDASEGNGALAGLSGNVVYAHTGVITDKSTSPSDWKYVQGNWGTADNQVKMTYIGNDRYSISYNIGTFYNVPNGEKILQMAFVFRNEDGSKVGRDVDGSDIYTKVYNVGDLSAKILQPFEVIFSQNDVIELEGAASESADLELFLNGTSIKTANGKSITSTYTASQSGNYQLVLSAKANSNEVRDTVNFVVNPSSSRADVPAGSKDGLNKLSSTSVRLVLTAPNKDYVYVLGDFNNWEVNTDYFMTKNNAGDKYWIDITGLDPAGEYSYQYYVDGEILVADPLSDVVLDPFNDQWVTEEAYPNMPEYPEGGTGIVSYFDMGEEAYSWKDGSYSRPNKEELVIYELHIRDFVAAHDYQTIIDSMQYFIDLGVNAIELMPVNEFEGNNSWGYNPSYHNAVDKYYGRRVDLKEFVDVCHQNGIAVIVDVVFNHGFSQNPLCQLDWDATNFKPNSSNPWVNPDAKHPFNVGYDFNHESRYTQNYMYQILAHWVNEYHIDGYRFDLSKGFTQKNTGSDVGAWSSYDASRIGLLKKMFDQLKNTDPNLYLILEHFADNSEEKELAEYGFMIWGNLVHEYTEAAMGYSANLNWGIHSERGWSRNNLVTYMESHDEERIAYKVKNFGNSSGNYNTRSARTTMDRVELAANFFFPIPGPKMFWQFTELGYDVSIETNGRTGEKPIRWNYFEQEDRKDLYKVFAELIHMKNDLAVFKTNDWGYELGGKVKRIWLGNGNDKVFIIGNFDVSDVNTTLRASGTGKWYEFWSGDSLQVDDPDMSVSLAPGEYRLYSNMKIEPYFEEEQQTNSVRLVSKLDRSYVYPNPAKGIIHVESIESSSVKVLSIDGKIVHESPSERTNHTIDITNWRPSIYIVQITYADGTTQSQRIITQ